MSAWLPPCDPLCPLKTPNIFYWVHPLRSILATASLFWQGFWSGLHTKKQSASWVNSALGILTNFFYLGFSMSDRRSMSDWRWKQKILWGVLCIWYPANGSVHQHHNVSIFFTTNLHFRFSYSARTLAFILWPDLLRNLWVKNFELKISISNGLEVWDMVLCIPAFFDFPGESYFIENLHHTPHVCPPPYHGENGTNANTPMSSSCLFACTCPPESGFLVGFTCFGKVSYLYLEVVPWLLDKLCRTNAQHNVGHCLKYVLKTLCLKYITLYWSFGGSTTMFKIPPPIGRQSWACVAAHVLIPQPQHNQVVEHFWSKVCASPTASSVNSRPHFAQTGSCLFSIHTRGKNSSLCAKVDSSTKFPPPGSNHWCN